MDSTEEGSKDMYISSEFVMQTIVDTAKAVSEVKSDIAKMAARQDELYDKIDDLENNLCGVCHEIDNVKTFKERIYGGVAVLSLLITGLANYVLAPFMGKV